MNVKLFVQIPCLNEEKTLPLVLESIPKKIAGIDDINILVIDDGSTDNTIEIAKKHGVEHFVLHAKNKGLSRSFSDGLDYCLAHGADIIVNTDGDNQYPQAKIADLVKPIIDSDAEIVIGDRETATLKHFSPLKRFLQKFGSRIVNIAANTNVADTVSGFRAYSREAAMQMYTINTFSYCTETIIHAGRKRIPMISVPVGANAPTRKSRLFKNMWQHIYKSGGAILKGYFMHEPWKIFVIPGAIMLLGSAIPFMRYGYLLITGQAGGHIQSLLAGAVLLITGFLFIGLGVIADLIKTNRILTENILETTKRELYNQNN